MDDLYTRMMNIPRETPEKDYLGTKSSGQIVKLVHDEYSDNIYGKILARYERDTFLPAKLTDIIGNDLELRDQVVKGLFPRREFNKRIDDAAQILESLRTRRASFLVRLNNFPSIPATGIGTLFAAMIYASGIPPELSVLMGGAAAGILYIPIKKDMRESRLLSTEEIARLNTIDNNYRMAKEVIRR